MSSGDACMWEKLDWDVASLRDDMPVTVPPFLVGRVKVGQDEGYLRPTAKEKAVQQPIEATKRRVDPVFPSGEQDEVNTIL